MRRRTVDDARGRIARSIRRLLLALALTATLPALAAAQADVITGRVTGPDGEPLNGALVEVISVELETTRSALTNQSGRYMLLFPDGGGRYVVRVSYVGMATVVQTLVRGDEELLLANVRMQTQAVALDTITVRAQPLIPGRGQTGEQSTNLAHDMVGRLPLADLDPATIALLAAGVIGTGVDSLTGRMNFSVAGMSDLLNQILLDGAIVGQGGLAVPEEGVRQTSVTTSTFDVSRGGFAGGQISMSSARGTNRATGAFNYRFDDDALQLSGASLTPGFTRHNLGGSWGGPLVRGRLFYHGSFQLQSNTNHRFALDAADPLAAQRSGVSLDSIARFLDILSSGYGMPLLGQTGAYQQRGSDLRVQGRLDWNAMQRRTQSHTLSARVNVNANAQDSTRISALDLVQRGGETERDNHMFGITLNSRVRTNWTHSLNAAFSESRADLLPFTEMPEGRVRVTSDFDDGTRETRTLGFGGNRSMPAESYTRDLQLSNELSLLVPWGPHLHRLKLGGFVQRQREISRSADNVFGSWSYASLADFAAQRPERYERALAERSSRTGRIDMGFFIGDTWRVTQPLELTFGVRFDHARLDQRPEHNPAVEAAFGRRTDVVPQASAFSPRLGFSYRLSEANEPARSLTGGVGIFTGRAPTAIFAQALRQTGLPDGDTRLLCIGDAVPLPDWNAFAVNGGFGPDTCADGGAGVGDALSSLAPAVTLVSPEQRLPASLRAELGYRAQLRPAVSGNVRYTYSRGMGLWGYRDINLDSEQSTTLAQEGRPFFGDVSTIVERTGATSFQSSRRHADFGHVFEITSDLASETHQLSAQLLGMPSLRTSVLLNYTLSFSRDQGVAGGGGMMGGGMMGMGGGFMPLPPTAGDPNAREWAAASGDRRHNINATIAHAVSPSFELAVLARAASGTPFTPMVGGDINGDGLRNDRAYVFDPADVVDPDVAAAMQRLLDSAPARVRNCLQQQLGRIAERNSCRNGWSQSLDVRAALRPNLPGLERRMTISIDARNMLTGLDQLLHGRDNMRGWGEGALAEPTLLNVRGYDAGTQAFIYEVNEGFGQNRRGVNALRNPFALTISARVQVGGNPAITNRGFGRGMGALAGAFEGMSGGMGGGAVVMAGGGGMAGGMGGGMMAAGGGGGMGIRIMDGQVVQIGGVDVRGMQADGGALLDALLINPVRLILERRAALDLTDAQHARLVALADTLDTQLAARRDALADDVAALTAHVQGIQQGRIPDRQAIMEVQARLRPQLEGVLRERLEATRLAQRALSAEQWERLPEELRAYAEPPQPMGGVRRPDGD